MSEDQIVDRVARAAHEATSLLPWELLPARERDEKIRHAGGVIEAYIAALQEAGFVIVPQDVTVESSHNSEEIIEHYEAHVEEYVAAVVRAGRRARTRA